MPGSAGPLTQRHRITRRSRTIASEPWLRRGKACPHRPHKRGVRLPALPAPARALAGPDAPDPRNIAPMSDEKATPPAVQEQDAALRRPSLEKRPTESSESDRSEKTRVEEPALEYDRRKWSVILSTLPSPLLMTPLCTGSHVCRSSRSPPRRRPRARQAPARSRRRARASSRSSPSTGSRISSRSATRARSSPRTCTSSRTRAPRGSSRTASSRPTTAGARPRTRTTPASPPATSAQAGARPGGRSVAAAPSASASGGRTAGRRARA
jgi:hypothetical protein